MGRLTHAVHWWEEWQLRVLVLSGLGFQFFLVFFPYLRRIPVPGWFRFLMWLAYHGADAVVIYALATLFNRHKDEGDVGGRGGGSSSNTLEVVWAPVLLIQLGGCDGVTAYNIEDNELWSRHLLTAVSQVTVAVYVFCKSWPGGDKRLLQTAILLFTVGIVKCFMKAWAFKRASINSLVSSEDGTKQINDGGMYNKLEKYVKDARDIVVRQQPEDHHQVMEEDVEDPGYYTTTSPPRVVEDEGEGQEARNNNPTAPQGSLFEGGGGEASKLFVDLSSPYPRRISIFEKFWGLSEERAAYDSVRGGLASAFFLLYTKLKTSHPGEEIYQYMGYKSGRVEGIGRACIQLSRVILPWATLSLFQHSHREAYNPIDVKVTYALLCCTALLEGYSSTIIGLATDDKDGPRHNNESSRELWPQTVAQYSLAGYFVRNKKHNNMMRMVSFVGCKDFLDQHWCMEPCLSSARITNLVLGYLKDGWKQKIRDADSYRSFNNHSSHWGLKMNRPFDECVLLWHLTTDFCFFSSSSFPDHKCAFAETPETLIGHMWRLLVQEQGTSVTRNPTSTTSGPQCSQNSTKCKAVQCRQMSNYMVYLLFVNPEMLLPGTRRNLFRTAYRELKVILRDWEWNPVCWSRYMPCGLKLIKEEAIVMNRLKTVMIERRASRRDTVISFTQQNSERTSQEESSMEGSNRDKTFIDNAWDLAQELLDKNEMERWKEIQDVWVQMLCFSASRCRGYLHAKAMGKGGEFLSYVWLLMFYMGMETFSERLQRELLPNYQGNNNTTNPPQTSDVRTTSTASSASTVHARAGTSMAEDMV